MDLVLSSYVRITVKCSPTVVKGMNMKDINISLMEINDLQESARVLSVAMLDNPLHYAVFQGKGEKERLEIG